MMSEAWDSLMAGKVPRHEQLRAGWKCPACGLCRERDNGPDPCMGELPGVDYACCGHGGATEASPHGRGYIRFSNGKVIRFAGAGVEVEDVS